MIKKGCALLIIWMALAVANASQPTKDVGIAVNINDVSAIYPKQELVDMELMISLRWQGEMRPDKTLYFQGDQVKKALVKEWWPYFQILHSRGSIDTKLSTLSVEPNGTINFKERLRVNIETAMDMHSFPFDSQILNIFVAPFGQSEYKTNYYPLEEEVKMSRSAHLDEWNLVSATQQTVTQDNTQAFQVSIKYQRKSGYYLYKILIPLLLILGISTAVLWLPQQPAINRLGVILTALLTVVAFQWGITNDMPMVSYITFIQAVLLFVFLLIGTKAAIIVIGEKEGRDKEKIMRYSRAIYPLVLITGLIIITLFWF